MGYLGGLTGAAAREELAASGLRDETVPIKGETRLTVFVVESSGEVSAAIRDVVQAVRTNRKL